MEISDNWMPLILQSVSDSIKYKEMLLQSETLRDIEDHEENLIFLSELLGYLKDEYSKNQHKFTLTPEEILGKNA
ncbi:hypothetical protein [Marinibactrum halimedae]|uniref:Uncharacterized protein n=1 Tax=Marinibactrum halimedae TaxID=1444977 RepID=A0AA37WK97_9GAMM|nr:hypothetical protein [Marinibactrum halimedae]MCD9460659.1 hypothetical protein [Marinibactrum halimedae]GLS24304.1 hypothetical protein GCM10007877_00150 [Marinibactrum halimedae]